MGGILPGIPALMTAFDTILAAFNVHNQRGNWFYQTERNRLPMVDVSPGQAALFFHTVEVNLNQITTMVGNLPASAAKAHAVDAKPEAKPKAKAGGQAGTTPATPEAAPATPVRSEGPAPKPQAQVASKDSLGKGKRQGPLDPARTSQLRTRRVNSVSASIEGSAQEANSANMDTSLVRMANL